MKFFLSLFFIVLSSGFVYAQQTYRASFDVSVYETPDFEAAKITTIPAGSDVTVTAIDQTNYWAKITLPNGKTGYVDSGSIDPIGGQTGAVADTFDAQQVAAKVKKQNKFVDTLLGTLFLLALLGAVVHMLSIRANKDDESRIYVGNPMRIILFSLLLLSGLFFIDGFWAKLVQVTGTMIIAAFSYYAYLIPQSKLIIDGPPAKDGLKILGGMWLDLESRKVNEVRVRALTEEIESYQARLNRNQASASDQQHISSLQDELFNEKTKINDTIALTFVSVILGVLFIWLTPFMAAVQYVRNYPLYLRKREKYRKKLHAIVSESV